MPSADTTSVFYRIGQSVTSAVETKFSELAAQQVNINSIGDISDVDTSAVGHVPTDGQALVWNASHNHWMPGDVSIDLSGDVTMGTVVDPTAAGASVSQIIADGAFKIGGVQFNTGDPDAASGVYEQKVSFEVTEDSNSGFSHLNITPSHNGGYYGFGVKITGNLGLELISGGLTTGSTEAIKINHAMAGVMAGAENESATMMVAGAPGDPKLYINGTPLSVSGLEASGNITVGGNLTVSGTTTTVNTANLDVKDNIVKLNTGGGSLFASGGAGTTSGIEVEAGDSVANGGNDRKARFVYNGGDATSAAYGNEAGFFETTYEEEDAANPGSPLSGHLRIRAKGVEIQNDASAAPEFDNLGNYEDFVAGLNA
jgi:hypothetical protein